MSRMRAGLLLFASHEIVRNQLSRQNIQFAAFPTTQAILVMVLVILTVTQRLERRWRMA